MTGYLTYDAELSRQSELRRLAGRRMPLADTLEPIALRRATDADRPALERLADLDSAQPLTGDVLVAELRGELQAAIEVGGGAIIADPFRPSAHLVDILVTRAARLREGAEAPRWVRLRSRSAYRAA